MQDKLKHYMELWDLKNPQLIAETFMSHVYRVEANGEILAIKVLSEDGAYDEVGGALALAYYGGNGAAQLTRYDEGAHLLEYLDGGDLIPLVEAGQDEEATRISAEVITKLHEQGGQVPELRSLKRWFRSLFEKAKADEVAGIESIYRRAVPVANELLANPEKEVVLHADIHHANIRHHSKRGWLAIDPKGIYGERTYDAANMLYNPNDAVSEDETRLFRTAGILAKALNLDSQRYLKFAYAYGCLSAAWSLEGDDAEGAASTLKIAAMLEEAIR
jgi:streptomycin 6-kinase